MSVHGEFERLLGDCLSFLAASEAAEAEGWCQELERARALKRDSLSDAARTALALIGTRTPDTPRFRSEVERTEFEGLLEHFGAICRLILGLPAYEDSDGGSR